MSLAIAVLCCTVPFLQGTVSVKVGGARANVLLYYSFLTW
jgi:hypothetical protein